MKFEEQARPATEVHLCDGCGKEIAPGAPKSMLRVELEVRGYLGRYWWFCSDGCRASWWATPGEEPFAPAHHPDKLPECTWCAGAGKAEEDDEQNRNGRCRHCGGTGRETPMLMCDHEGPSDDRADRDFKVRITTLSSSTAEAAKVYAGAVACPCDLDAWWKGTEDDGIPELVPAQPSPEAPPAEGESFELPLLPAVDLPSFPG